MPVRSSMTSSRVSAIAYDGGGGSSRSESSVRCHVEIISTANHNLDRAASRSRNDDRNDFNDAIDNEIHDREAAERARQRIIEANKKGESLFITLIGIANDTGIDTENFLVACGFKSPEELKGDKEFDESLRNWHSANLDTSSLIYSKLEDGSEYLGDVGQAVNVADVNGMAGSAFAYSRNYKLTTDAKGHITVSGDTESKNVSSLLNEMFDSFNSVKEDNVSLLENRRALNALTETVLVTTNNNGVSGTQLLENRMQKSYADITGKVDDVGENINVSAFTKTMSINDENVRLLNNVVKNKSLPAYESYEWDGTTEDGHFNYKVVTIEYRGKSYQVKLVGSAENKSGQPTIVYAGTQSERNADWNRNILTNFVTGGRGGSNRAIYEQLQGYNIFFAVCERYGNKKTDGEQAIYNEIEPLFTDFLVDMINQGYTGDEIVVIGTSNGGYGCDLYSHGLAEKGKNVAACILLDGTTNTYYTGEDGISRIQSLVEEDNIDNVYVYISKAKNDTVKNGNNIKGKYSNPKVHYGELNCDHNSKKINEQFFVNKDNNYFYDAVEKNIGRGVDPNAGTGITDFNIYEDGKLISELEGNYDYVTSVEDIGNASKFMVDTETNERVNHNYVDTTTSTFTKVNDNEPQDVNYTDEDMKLFSSFNGLDRLVNEKGYEVRKGRIYDNTGKELSTLGEIVDALNKELGY